jgi:hypothetical protein
MLFVPQCADEGEGIVWKKHKWKIFTSKFFFIQRVFHCLMSRLGHYLISRGIRVSTKISR